MAPSTRTGRRRGERGYTLVVLIGVLTVMAIALAAAIPHWVALESRERESELIARGFQYAEAIRVFQKRFGRLPTRLDELLEVEPRSIRQLWEDPIAHAPFLVLMEVGGTVVPIDPETGEVVAQAGGQEGEEQDGRPGPTPRPQPRPAPRSSPPPPGGGQGPGVAGPIHGVKSRARGESYHELFGQSDVGDWEFTVERLIAAASAKTADGLLRRADYATLGKGFRYPPPGGIPGMDLPKGGTPQPQPPQPLPGQTPPQPEEGGG